RSIDDHQALAAERGGGIAADVHALIGSTPRAQRQQQPKLRRIGLELAVGGGPQLKRPQPHHSGVRPAEDPQAEDADHDKEDNGSHGGGEQLGTDPGPYTANGAYQGIVGSAQRLPMLLGGRSAVSSLRGTLRGQPQGLRMAVDATDLVISHRPLMRATS